MTATSRSSRSRPRRSDFLWALLLFLNLSAVCFFARSYGDTVVSRSSWVMKASPCDDCQPCFTDKDPRPNRATSNSFDLSVPETGNRSAMQQLMMPLSRVQQAFQGGIATVFVLRIQKTASTVLDLLFSTALQEGECTPNMRFLEGAELPPPQCSQLFVLLHYGERHDTCKNNTGMDDSTWAAPDCVPWIFSYQYEETYDQLRLEDKGRIRESFLGSRLISGHFSYGLHRIGHRGFFTYVTTLRDPLKRVVSYWNVNTWRLRKELANVTFDDYVMKDYPFGGFQKSNHMVRVLCGEGTGLRYDIRESMWMGGDDGPREGDNTTVQSLNPITEVHFNCALQHLINRFSLVFVAEKINEVHELRHNVSRLFNMKVLAEFPKRAVHRTKFKEGSKMVSLGNVSKTCRQRLHTLNAWDLLLYQKAKILHDISISRLRDL